MNESGRDKWYGGGLAFECQGCGGCCSGPDEGYVWVTRENSKEMAEFLGMDEEEFRQKYVRPVGRRYSLKEKKSNNDCVLLNEAGGNGKGCRVYQMRPQQCRTWPFWKDNVSSRRAWEQEGRKCPGMDRGSWFSGEAIEAAAEGDVSACASGIEVAEAAVKWIEANLDNDECHGAVDELYAMLDRNIQAASGECENCGKCCDFDDFDHRLYATTLEMLYFAKGMQRTGKSGGKGKKARLKGACRYQKRQGCAMRDFRPAGCRIFYCSGLEPEFQHELTELVLTSLRGLHEQFGAVYYYADLQEWLARLDS